MRSAETGEWIKSVGIDIGTSTTKMIVSRLKVARTSSSLALPRYEIVERELLYASPVYATPLTSGDDIDAPAISSILAKEYAEAACRPSDLKSGAVIITGETANKRNAERIVHLLAESSGRFVVATAGADLEALLAGKGSGAEQRSRATKGIVASIDIGGGTANAALFQRGKLAGTATFHLGGRLLQTDAGGVLTGVSPSLLPWLRTCGYRLEAGQHVGWERLKGICEHMCKTMISYLAGYGRHDDIRALLLSEPSNPLPPIEEWMISGGIGQLMNEPAPASPAAMARFGDVGPLLAQSLKHVCQAFGLKLVQPAQTVRATVIGAGMQSTEISGATVHADHTLLPLRNLPVAKLELTAALLTDRSLLKEAFGRMVEEGASLFGVRGSPPFALALGGGGYCSYQTVQALAEETIAAYKRQLGEVGQLVVICEGDTAKALGQSLERRCGERPRIVCIDQINVRQGDYIDIGEPIGGSLIPVVVKTLAFHRKEGGEEAAQKNDFAWKDVSIRRSEGNHGESE
ncbi:ethanolamine ammonia-lyase reactivating factor EutA [Paenibacillus sp. MBLB4367]|uniref:ethanolamine ammonia-lyase reactivating factor EutA n=1 Tax=Paenibacillus sp. MBLB4367 TaxID=3384767 RepID=UPI003907F2FB